MLRTTYSARNTTGSMYATETMLPVPGWSSWAQVGAQFRLLSVVFMGTRPPGVSDAFDLWLYAAAAVTNNLAGVSQQSSGEKVAVAAGSNALWVAAAIVGK